MSVARFFVRTHKTPKTIPLTASVTIEFIDNKLSVVADGKTVREASPPQ